MTLGNRRKEDIPQNNPSVEMCNLNLKIGLDEERQVRRGLREDDEDVLGDEDRRAKGDGDVEGDGEGAAAGDFVGAAIGKVVAMQIQSTDLCSPRNNGHRTSPDLPLLRVLAIQGKSPWEIRFHDNSENIVRNQNSQKACFYFIWQIGHPNKELQF